MTLGEVIFKFSNNITIKIRLQEKNFKINRFKLTGRFYSSKRVSVKISGHIILIYIYIVKIIHHHIRILSNLFSEELFIT